MILKITKQELNLRLKWKSVLCEHCPKNCIPINPFTILQYSILCILLWCPLQKEREKNTRVEIIQLLRARTDILFFRETNQWDILYIEKRLVFKKQAHGLVGRQIHHLQYGPQRWKSREVLLLQFKARDIVLWQVTHSRGSQSPLLELWPDWMRLTYTTGGHLVYLMSTGFHVLTTPQSNHSDMQIGVSAKHSALTSPADIEN